MRRVLAISGKRFSGKDTFAGILGSAARARSITLETYAFAAESKRMFVAAQHDKGVEVDLARLVGDDRAYKETWRPALTEFTVAAIALDRHVFCRAVGDRIAASEHPALITDLRLCCEIEHLSQRFTLNVVRLQRSDADRALSGWTHDAVKDEHYTETELDDPALWTSIVTNAGAPDSLEDDAVALLRWLVP